jgi:hypothetical protein
MSSNFEKNNKPNIYFKKRLKAYTYFCDPTVYIIPVLKSIGL